MNHDVYTIGDEVVFFSDDFYGCEGGTISHLSDLFAVIEINEFLQITVPFDLLTLNRS